MLKNILKIVLPFALGIAILWWMYRGTDWSDFWHNVCHEMNWGWMLFSLIFGILPQVFRALRWRQTLAPMGENARVRTSIDSIFVSYAASLVVPRIGEVMRCSTLKRMDGVSFSKSLGTVVTERIVDMLVMALFTLIALLTQLPTFVNFMETTGTSLDSILNRFTGTGYIVTLICGITVVITLGILFWRYKMFKKGKDILLEVKAGILSLRNVDRVWLYLFYSLGIWVCYYLHFYLAFFSFDLTAGIPPMYGLLMFCVGTYAVLVPTPNGAGPWHFAVKTTIVIFFADAVMAGQLAQDYVEAQAIMIALVIHTIETALVVLLGAYGWADLNFIKRKDKEQNN